MTVPRVVITRNPPGDIRPLLDDVSDIWMWPENVAIPDEVLKDQVASAHGLYCMLTDRIDEDLLSGAAELRAISQMAVGVDNIDLAACTARGIPVGHTPDVLTETTADTAFGLVIAAARRFGEGSVAVSTGGWGPWDPNWLLGQDIFGSTLGIIGLGRIGKSVARRASGFRMKVIYTKRTRDPTAEQALGVEWRTLDALLAESDHVVVLTSLTDQTRGLIGREQFGLMKPSATIVNVSRGPVVDTDALSDALSMGEIAAAGLDVTDPEPIPVDHALVRAPNCFIIPHLGSATVRTRVHMAELAVGNLLAALSGERMPHCANPAVYA